MQHDPPKYQLIRLLGTGGMGRIYLGRDCRDGQHIALKTVAGGPSKFLVREFEILRRLSHPNIVKVYDWFELNGNAYFAMEHVEGASSLLDYMRTRQGRFDERVADSFRQLMDALDYVHSNNIIHYDLCPDNILLDAYGHLRIVDFEHARQLRVDEREYWPPGTIAGTPPYMSPEHLQGHVHIESDYFVVGTLLVEHLAGRNPFVADGRIESTLAAIVNVDTEAMLSTLSGIPDSLPEIIRSLLHRQAERRRDGWALFRMLSEAMKINWNISVGVEDTDPQFQLPQEEVGTLPTQSNGQGIRPRVFISYTHDSPQHQQRVLALAQQLRSDGIECIIDQFVNASPSEGWPLWMERQIEEADFVLVVCTANYLRRYRREEQPGMGLRSTWEAVLTRQELYEAQGDNRKFVPVLFEDVSSNYIPKALRPYSYHRLPNDHERLLRYLTDQPEVVPQPVAQVPPIQPTSSGVHHGDVSPSHGFSMRGKSAMHQAIATAGQRVGPYLLRGFLGAGGSGLVFRAFHSTTGRELCLKVFYPLLMASEMGAVLAAVAQSVRALAALNNPNIIKVFDFGDFEFEDSQRSCYLAMELVRGQPLDEWSGQLSHTNALAARLQVAYALASAFHVAHTCRYLSEVGIESIGLLHGDIKPANILVRDESTPIIVDFLLVDIQRRIQPWGGQSNYATMAFGTPNFMAPEQEKDGIITVRTDIYGLGKTYMNLFFPTGRSSNRDKTQDALLDLLQAMMADRPEARPESMRTVAAMLSSIAQRLDIPLVDEFP